MKQQRKESSTRGYRRTGLDWFGIVMMFVLVDGWSLVIKTLVQSFR